MSTCEDIERRGRLRAILLIAFRFHQSLPEWRGQTELTIGFRSHKCLTYSQCDVFCPFVRSELLVFVVELNVIYVLNTTLHTTGEKKILPLPSFNISLCKRVYMGQFVSRVNTRISQK
jgi:hypothetical protein